MKEYRRLHAMLLDANFKVVRESGPHCVYRRGSLQMILPHGRQTFGADRNFKNYRAQIRRIIKKAEGISA